MVLLELACEPVDDPLVEIFAAQECIAICGLYLEHTVTDLE
jgi:hypothetical protein